MYCPDVKKERMTNIFHDSRRRDDRAKTNSANAVTLVLVVVLTLASVQKSEVFTFRPVYLKQLRTDLALACAIVAFGDVHISAEVMVKMTRMIYKCLNITHMLATLGTHPGPGIIRAIIHYI